MASPSLVDALLFGRTDGVSAETLFLFARTGLIHCFSASGFHMGVALGIARFLGLALSRPFASARAQALATLVCSLGLMVFFGAQTEWSSPMVRAFTFAGALSLARFLELRAGKRRLFLISLAAAALLGRGTWLSFALSALGMAAILSVRPRNTAALLLAPWAASLPLSLWYFQLFSLSAPLWNLTVGTALGFFVLPPAILGLCLRALHLPSEQVFFFAERAMEVCVNILEKGDALLGLAYWVQPLLFFAVGGLLLAAVFFRVRYPRVAGAFALLALALPALTPTPFLAALNVGQGDAIFLRTRAGERVLVDGGPAPFRARESRAARALESLGVGPLDHLLFSHFDGDHVGGDPAVLARHPVRVAAWARESELNDRRALPVLAALERSRVPLRFLERHAPASLRCWLPPPVSSNESSALCHALLPKGASIWLTGDAGFASERWLLKQGVLPKASYLKVAHHGSKFSGSPEFLRAVGARTALVSVGARNRYGHPAPPLLARLRAAGLAIRHTDQEGSLVIYDW